jgi:YbbR-like protein
MYDRILSSLVALSLAVLVWLYARSRNLDTLDSVPVPVRITLAADQANDYEMEITGTSQVPVSFMGTASRLRGLRGMLQQGALLAQAPLRVPDDRLNDSRYVADVRIDESNIQAPHGVTPLVLEGRNHVQVCLRRLVERRLPVHFTPAPDDFAGQVVIEPSSVLVRGPKEILDRTRVVPTQPFNLPDIDAALEEDAFTAGAVPLVRELEGRPVEVTPATVKIRLTLKPGQKLYELTDVPVEFLCPANFPWRTQFVGGPSAGRISLRILGPALSDPPAVTAYIDLTTAGRHFESGLYMDEPIRLQLPKDFELAQSPPKAATFRLTATVVKQR